MNHALTQVLLYYSFLTHKRYKALLDGNGTEYNYIIHCEEQQKLGLEGLSDEEDYTKEDDDEEDDEDEEADSDDGGPRTVVGGGGKRNMMEAFHMLNGSGGQSRGAGEECGSHGRQGFTEASRETRTSVVALLSEVAGLSNEKIATFAKVPFTMSQLRDKYELLRRAEIALIQQKQNQGGRFKPGEVIELDDTEEDGGGGDSVVVLDSDEEEDDEDEENIAGGTAIKSKESGKQEKAGPKGWGEYDDGDDDCWGSADVHTKDIADNLSSTTGSGKGDKDDSIDPSKNKKGAADSKTGAKETENEISSELKQKEKASSEDIDMCKENASEDKGSEVSAVPNGNTLVTGSTGKGALEGGSEEDTTCSQKRLESVEKDKTSTVEGVQNDEALNSGTDSDKAKAHSTEGQASAFTGGLSVDFSSPDKEDDAGVERVETDGDASNDSDDVICIESESATPSSVHNLLSQTRSTVVTKSVTFMSNITTHSTYVTAKVGFGSWDSLIHFNYTGDSTHLPTVMTAESQSAAATGTSNKGSDVSKEVYERLFPPVSTLVPGSKSLGAVIKQRVKGLPCLTSAYLKLSTGGVPVSSSNTIYSSIMATGSSSNNRDPAPSQSGNRQSPQKQQHTRQAKFHQSTPQPFKTPPEKNPAILSSAVSPIAATDTQTFTPEIKATSTSSDSINAAQSSTSKSHFNSEIVTKYLKVLIEPNDSSKDVHNTDTNDVGETNQSSVSILSNLVKQLHHLHFESSSGKSSSLPSSPEATSLLTQFHTLFSEYLSDTGLSPDKEPDFLQSLVSKRENPFPFLDKEVLDSLKKLTGFQVKLLEDRLNHITNKSDRDCIIAEGASPRRKGKDKRKNSDTETSDSKRLKTDNSEEDRVIDPSCNSEVKLLENGIKSTGEKDSTSVELNSSKTGGIPEPTSMDAKNDEAGEDKCKKESVEVSLKSDGRSMEENKNRNLEDSTSENCISESTAGESKGANKGQGNSNDSTVDRISIGSSSEEEDMDDSDSNSDCSIEISAGPSLDARALCRSDDPDGELFVINNTSEEEELEDDGEEAEEAIRNAHRWKPCVKEDPYPVQEKLYLMLEEVCDLFLYE